MMAACGASQAASQGDAAAIHATDGTMEGAPEVSTGQDSSDSGAPESEGSAPDAEASDATLEVGQASDSGADAPGEEGQEDVRSERVASDARRVESGSDANEAGDAACRPFAPMVVTLVPRLSGVVTGDFNGDGHVDVVGIIRFHSVVALLGNGDGTLGPPIESTLQGIGDLIGSVVDVGDVDGDGTLDVALDVVFGGVSGIRNLLGNGDGTFRSGVFLPINTTGVRLRDLKGDGRLDLLSSDVLAVGVSLGNGDGTFGPPVSYPTPGEPGGMTIADFNGDGHPDVAVVLQSCGVSVLLGNGDGTFQAQTLLPGCPGFAIVSADFNRDGHLDLAADGTFVWLGRGDGTFQKPYSDSTAKLIDDEVKRIADECFQEACRLLKQNRGKLDDLAHALLESDSLNEKQILDVTGLTPPAKPPLASRG